MSHTHPWAKVGIRDPPWYDSLHEGTYDRVTPGVPPRSNHRDGAMLTGGLPERTTQGEDIGMDIEAIYGTYPPS